MSSSNSKTSQIVTEAKMLLGTENVISACRKYGVGRLIYCSSIEVVQGKENIYGGNEDNTQPREHGHMFEIYGHTKMKAEHLVLQANCKYTCTNFHLLEHSLDAHSV